MRRDGRRLGSHLVVGEGRVKMAWKDEMERGERRERP